MNNQPAYTVIGSTLSTFTRTITLGLRHKGLEYTHILEPPHSRITFSTHPFGYIPALVIHTQNEDEDIKLCESQAIARYIDRAAPEPSLNLEPGKGVALEEKMWEFVSLVAAFGKPLCSSPKVNTAADNVCFIGMPIIEFSVVEPRMKAQGKLTEEEIRAQLEDGPIEELQRYLEVAERLMAPEGYIFGDRLTWADFFLYPIMADLRTVREWEVVSKRLHSWMNKMDLLPEVQETAEGTLASGLTPRPLVPRKYNRMLRPIPTA